MAGKVAPDEPLAVLAGRQHGVVERDQARRLGFTDHEIDGRITRGLLRPLHRGVYLVGGAQLTRYGHWMAATLAGGPGAALSHRSAAELWTLIPGCSSFVDVTVPGRGGRKRRKGLAIHRFHQAPQVLRRRAIPVTTPLRTLRDFKLTTDGLTFDRAVAEAERLRLCTSQELDDLLPVHTPTQNEFEQRFLKLCEQHRIPRPECQAEIGPYKLDFLWPAQFLIVETDGRATHGTRQAFEDDRARSAELTIMGYRVLRFTWLQLTDRPEWVARTVLAALGV